MTFFFWRCYCSDKFFGQNIKTLTQIARKMPEILPAGGASAPPDPPLPTPMFRQHLRTPVPGHLSSHFALSSYEIFAPLAFWRISVFFRPTVQPVWRFPASGVPSSSAVPPSLGRGQVTATTSNTICCKIFIYVNGIM